MAKKPVRKTGRRKPSDVVYCGPEGWVILRKNGRTKLWEAHCKPEGSTRHVTVPMKSIRKADAKEEAIFTLRHECQHLLISRPSSDHAKDAVRTLIAYAGDNPNREGLRDTPERVVRAYDEFFSGYHLAATDVLKTTFSETGAYDEMVVLTDIDFESHCEHHMVPFVGAAHIAYLPNKTVVGISKLARLVEVYAKRLQIQEKMTTQIADNLNITLKPKGVAVVVEARHQCMTSRGVKKKNVKMVTSCMTGVFREDGRTRSEFMNMIGNPRNRGF